MAEVEGIAGLDTSVAHPARVYDYWLGGTDNFAADREAAERVLAVAPGLRYRVRANRAFLGRATRYLAAEAGLRQFLDIGTGIPAAGNTHEVAQRAAPDARVVYVDNDRCKSGCTHDCWVGPSCLKRTRERKCSERAHQRQQRQTRGSGLIRTGLDARTLNLNRALAREK